MNIGKKILTNSKIRLTLLFYTLITFLLLTSCSSYEIADRYTSKKLERGDCIHQSVVVDSISIDYWDNQLDNKPVLVLIHGFGATAEFQWYKQIKSLKKDYRIIVPSLLYFGNTKPLGKNRYSIQDQVDLITSLLDTLNINKVHLCGVSYGGLVSAEITKRYPQRVNKLILIDAILKFYGEEEIQAMCNTYEVKSYQDIFVPKDHKAVKRLFDLVYYKPPPVPAFLFKSVHEEIYEENIPNYTLLLESLYSSMGLYQSREYDFSNKTLIIWGEFDDAVPIKTAYSLDEHIPNSKLEIIPKTKHMPNLEKPKFFNELILSFLE